MCEPIVGAKPLAGIVLLDADQRSPIPVLAALEPTERTFPLVDHHGSAHTADFSLAQHAQLMLRPEGVVRLHRHRTLDGSFHALTPAREKRVDQRADRPFQMLEPPVELGIVASILDHDAGMSDSGAVASEQCADLG